MSVPAPIATAADIPVTTMSPAMAIMLDDKLFERAKQIATYLSKAAGFVPPHLIGQPEACFAVVTRALTWKLDPYAVAQCTYQTPGGRVGFEGKLCQAILENSGKLEGHVEYEHIGDWSRIAGKFQIRKSDKGKDYAVPTWTREDAQKHGLGVIVRAQVKGERKPREWTFMLEQAFPLNSTLWATDPKSQICYTAVRRFGNLAAPGLFMGVPFERDDVEERPMRVVGESAPRPTRADFQEKKLEPVTDVAETAATEEAAQDEPETEAAAGADAIEEDESWDDWLALRQNEADSYTEERDIEEMAAHFKGTLEELGAPIDVRQRFASIIVAAKQRVSGGRKR